MIRKKSQKNLNVDEKKRSALFIPAGTLLGLGFGFLINDVPAGLFLGIGAGFLVFAIESTRKK